MSAREIEAPSSASGGLRPGTIVRIVMVALGIASATLLAHSAFGIRFNEDFMLFLGIVHDAIGFIVTPFELLIVKPVVRWLHEQGWVFELRDHWRNAFVLLWLFLAAVSRVLAPLSEIGGSAGATDAIAVPFRWAWAALVALIGGGLAGTVPLDHPAVLWWPVMGFFLHRSGDNLIYALKDSRSAAHGAFALVFTALFAALALGWVEPPALAGQPPLFWWAIAAFLAYQIGIVLIVLAASRRPRASTALYPIFLTVAGALALGVLPGPEWLDFRGSPSPGLANLAAFVVVLAAWYLLLGLLDPDEGEDSYLDRVLSDFEVRAALDILTVLGGAAAIVYAAHQLA